jgi:hypothetical protein
MTGIFGVWFLVCGVPSFAEATEDLAGQVWVLDTFYSHASNKTLELTGLVFGFYN